MSPYPVAPLDPDNGKLSWFALVIRAIALLLLPSLVAGYLIFFLVTSVDARMIHIQETLRLHQIDAMYALKANEAQTVQLQAMFRLLQQICVNTARSAEDRAICWNPWR